MDLWLIGKRGISHPLSGLVVLILHITFTNKICTLCVQKDSSFIDCKYTINLLSEIQNCGIPTKPKNKNYHQKLALKLIPKPLSMLFIYMSWLVFYFHHWEWHSLSALPFDFDRAWLHYGKDCNYFTKPKFETLICLFTRYQSVSVQVMNVV